MVRDGYVVCELAMHFTMVRDGYVVCELAIFLSSIGLHTITIEICLIYCSTGSYYCMCLAFVKHAVTFYHTCVWPHCDFSNLGRIWGRSKSMLESLSHNPTSHEVTGILLSFFLSLIHIFFF